MAFYSRIGSMLSQTISQSSGSSMMNVIRCMSSGSLKLFVGGLSYGTDDGSLREAFSNFGEVVDARVITDRTTGRSRGFGFVNFADTEAANSALAMDGQDLQGRNIRVSFASERPPRQDGGFGGGDGGGYQDRGYAGHARANRNY